MSATLHPLTRLHGEATTIAGSTIPRYIGERSATAISFREMTTVQADLDLYVASVCAGMSPEDVHAPDELAQRLQDGRLMAWWALRGGERAGWCALAPRHGKYLAGAWHLYGTWTRDDLRRQGIASAMWDYRITLVPAGTPVTVSIQADKPASLALAHRFGFRELGSTPPWTNYVLDNA